MVPPQALPGAAPELSQEKSPKHCWQRPKRKTNKQISGRNHTGSLNMAQRKVQKIRSWMGFLDRPSGSGCGSGSCWAPTWVTWYVSSLASPPPPPVPPAGRSQPLERCRESKVWLTHKGSDFWVGTKAMFVDPVTSAPRSTWSATHPKKLHSGPVTSIVCVGE